MKEWTTPEVLAEFKKTDIVVGDFLGDWAKNHNEWSQNWGRA